MRLVLSVLPAAVCAVAMFFCFRMMRHSDMPADGHAEGDDLEALRKEVADLREELARARSVQSDAAADGMRRIVRRGACETASDSRIVVSGMGQATLTRDAGRTWERLAVPEGASVVEIDANDPDTLYAGVGPRGDGGSRVD